MEARLSADIGGTFTDLVLLDENGALYVQKTPSTPADFTQGVLDGVSKILGDVGGNHQERGLLSLKDINYFVHGSTVVLNALLERKLPTAALITTKGFRDVLEIMRTNNPYMYDMHYIKPKPLIPRRLRFEVSERVAHTGEVVRNLDEAAVREVGKRIDAEKIATVAVCLLHAYANAEHEQRIKKILGEEIPGVSVCLSSDVASEIREFERTSTTVINATTIPIITSYLDRLSEKLREQGLKRELYLMQSNGGIVTVSAARELPVKTVMSGPSGGVVGASYLAKEIGCPDVVTIDMGGTSSDMGVISEERAVTIDESEVDHWPILAPMIEIQAIGAGGGSVAWLDSGNALRVGPQSAGADPGPVCYQRGGTDPTVTDACCVLGRINPNYFLGGEMLLDSKGAEDAIRRKIAEPLGLTVYEAAEGIIKVVATNMAKTMWEILVARGHDPRIFTIMAFGGAGGLVAGNLLRMGEIPVVIVPNNPGALSAIGMLATDFRHDVSQTHLSSFEDTNWKDIKAIMADMQNKVLDHLMNEGVERKNCSTEYAVDVRYVGQEHYLQIQCARGKLGPAKLKKDFNDLHEKKYGHCTPEFPVEIVNLRVFGTGKTKRPALPIYGPRKKSDVRLKPQDRRPVCFDNDIVETMIYRVERLCPGDDIVGPGIIEDPRSTIVILPGQRATVDTWRNIIIKDV